MSGIRTDVSRWPLVVVTFPDRRVSDDEFRAFIDDQRAFVSRREPHVVIADVRHAKVISAAQRRPVAAWLAEAEPVSREFTLAMAIVVDNPMMRGGIAAVFWLKEPPVPTKAVGSMQEALDHVLGVLHEKGIAAPDVSPNDF